MGFPAKRTRFVKFLQMPGFRDVLPAISGIFRRVGMMWAG
jgi:hypothetical protein